MWDEQTDEATEATADDDTATEAEGSSEESAVADAVDQQAATSDGSAAAAAPEVPDDASEKIAAAQEHINNLNMDKEREAAEQSAKRL